MANNIVFRDYSMKVKAALNDAVIAWLHEASGAVEAQAKRNSRVDTGQLKGSWKYVVDEGKLESQIGSPLQNAIWEEFGTGEFAANGNGRKTPWKYQDAKGNWHVTRGKRPNRTLQRAIDSKRNAIISRFKQIMKGLS